MKFPENTSKARSKTPQYGFQPVYYFSRCVGLWPFTIIHNSNGSLKEAHVHPFDSLWFLISICMHLTAIYYTYEDFEEFQHSSEAPYFMDLINYLTQIPLLSIEAFGIVLDMLNRKFLVNILNKFIVFDRRVC